MEEKKVKRGDVWFAVLPLKPHSHVQGGTRPVLVYQADRINEKSSVVNVLAITSKIKRLDLPYHVKLPWTPGLVKRSMVLAEQAFTLDQSKLFNYRCTLSEDVMKQVDRARRSVERGKPNPKQKRHRRRKARYDSNDLMKKAKVKK